jgi:hypothetical protein
MQALITIARYLAKRAVKTEWRAQGRKVQYIEAREITKASDIYLLRHKLELLREARNHPVVIRHLQQQGMRLARKAVIAEIRDRGRKVNSIAPDELRRLIEAYVSDHPELRECGCF